ncbi:hypothetical protein, partial [uncultured Nitrospira sp.]|uniref:hypothetical protein n=1 Tax=uncultured Nitrospira sp. TaxID=157176 RepID=UPI003140763C
MHSRRTNTDEVLHSLYPGSSSEIEEFVRSGQEEFQVIQFVVAGFGVFRHSRSRWANVSAQ